MRPVFVIAAVLGVSSLMQVAGQAPQQKAPHRRVLSARSWLLASMHGRYRQIRRMSPTQHWMRRILDRLSCWIRDWRVGVTANPDAAKPEFDDTTWQVRNAKEAIADVPDQDHPEDATEKGWEEASQHGGHQRPWVWFRVHLKLAPGHGPVALLIELPVTQNTSMTIGASGPGLDVFANGTQILPEGPHGDATYKYEEISRLYHIKLPPARPISPWRSARCISRLATTPTHRSSPSGSSVSAIQTICGGRGSYGLCTACSSGCRGW